MQMVIKPRRRLFFFFRRSYNFKIKILEIYKYFGFEDDDDEYAKGRYEAYNEIKENFEKTISVSFFY
jgi:hypothetical protein